MRTSREAWAVAALAVSFVTGCGNEVLVAGGSGGSGGSSSSVGGHEVSAVGNGSGGSGSSGGGCNPTPLGTAVLELKMGGDVVPSNGPPPNQLFDLVIEGSVQASPPSNGPERTLVLDTCPPNADCIGSLATLTVTAANLPASAIPEGTFVHLHYAVARTSGPDLGSNGFGAHVLVENLPSWGGLSNPTSQGHRVWLDVVSMTGAGQPAPGLAFDPFDLKVASVCTSPTGQSIPTDTFSMPGAPSVDVGIGEQKSVDAVGDRAGHYTFALLSHSTDLDGGTYLTYWVTGQ